MPTPAKRTNSFVRQAAILAAASLFVRFIGFLYRIPFTRLIGDAGMADYTTAYQVFTFFIALTSGALPVAISRLVSERIAREQYLNAHKIFKTSLIFATAAGGIAGLIMLFGAEIITYFMGAPGATLAIRSFAPTVVIVGILAVFRGYFQGMKTAIPTATSQVVEQIFKVVMTLWLAHLFFNAANLSPAVAAGTIGTGIAAAAGLAVVMVLYAIVAKDLHRRVNRDKNYAADENRRTQIAAIVKTAAPMLLAMTILSASGLLDLQMASGRMLASLAFSDEAVRIAIGQFQNIFILLITLPVALSVALSAAVVPDITSSSVQMNHEAVKHKTNMALRLSMILSIPSAIGLSVLADPIVTLLFGRYQEGGWLLRYGAASIIFIALYHVLTGALQGLGYIKLPVIAVFIGVLIKIPINYVLIALPSINILGTVISTIACYIVAAGINMYFLYKHTGILPDLSAAFIKPLVASVGMGMICYVTYHLINIFAPSPVATIGALCAGAASYVLFMCVIKGFRESDLQAMPLPQKVKSLLLKL